VRVGTSGIIDYGMAMSRREGEAVTGDRHVIRVHPRGVILAVIDGLGHGEEAAAAANAAAQVVETHPSTDIVEILTASHERLRAGRGVVMTMVSITPAAHIFTAVGVGNVTAMVVHPAGSSAESARDFVLLRGGVIGHLLPGLRPSVMQVTPGDLFVLATDGISIEFMTEERLTQPPQGIADRILARHAVRTDDALVLVARYVGE
jgi:phosphoserine phosphatase RsbX